MASWTTINPQNHIIFFFSVFSVARGEENCGTLGFCLGKKKREKRKRKRKYKGENNESSQKIKTRKINQKKKQQPKAKK